MSALQVQIAGRTYRRRRPPTAEEFRRAMERADRCSKIAKDYRSVKIGAVDFLVQGLVEAADAVTELLELPRSEWRHIDAAAPEEITAAGNVCAAWLMGYARRNARHAHWRSKMKGLLHA